MFSEICHKIPVTKGNSILWGVGEKKKMTLSEITGFATLKTTVVNSINLKDH